MDPTTRLPVILEPVGGIHARPRVWMAYRAGAPEGAAPSATVRPLPGGGYEALTDAGERVVFDSLSEARRELWLYALAW